jgi:hypothetical protein
MGMASRDTKDHCVPQTDRLLRPRLHHALTKEGSTNGKYTVTNGHLQLAGVHRTSGGMKGSDGPGWLRDLVS